VYGFKFRYDAYGVPIVSSGRPFFGDSEYFYSYVIKFSPRYRNIRSRYPYDGTVAFAACTLESADGRVSCRMCRILFHIAVDAPLTEDVDLQESMTQDLSVAIRQ
jgi:hypothetical protein